MDDSLEIELGELEAEPHPAARVFGGKPVAGRAVVLPSAYNPPTIGHVALLESAAAAAGVECQLALLTTRNVDKGMYGASLADRVRMLLALGEGAPNLAVAASNQARIVDQATVLRRSFPALEFDVIVGFDTLVRLFEPRYYTDMNAELEPFFLRHRVIAANRGGVSSEEVRDWVEHAAPAFVPRIVVIEVSAEAAAASSTGARTGIAGGVPVLPVPESVRAVIERRGLYGHVNRENRGFP